MWARLLDSTKSTARAPFIRERMIEWIANVYNRTRLASIAPTARLGNLPSQSTPVAVIGDESTNSAKAAS